MIQIPICLSSGVWGDLATGRDALRVAATGCLVFATDGEHAGPNLISFVLGGENRILQTKLRRTFAFIVFKILYL